MDGCASAAGIDVRFHRGKRRVFYTANPKGLKLILYGKRLQDPNLEIGPETTFRITMEDHLFAILLTAASLNTPSDLGAGCQKPAPMIVPPSSDHATHLTS